MIPVFGKSKNGENLIFPWGAGRRGFVLKSAHQEKSIRRFLTIFFFAEVVGYLTLVLFPAYLLVGIGVLGFGIVIPIAYLKRLTKELPPTDEPYAQDKADFEAYLSNGPTYLLGGMFSGLLILFMAWFLPQQTWFNSLSPLIHGLVNLGITAVSVGVAFLLAKKLTKKSN